MVLGQRRPGLSEVIAMSDNNVFDILYHMSDDEVLEDRREYSPDMLRHMYGLSHQEAADLHYLVQREFDPKLSATPELEKCDPATVFECIVEGWHAGMDGWTPHEQAVILRYCDDLRRYCAAAKGKL